MRARTSGPFWLVLAATLFLGSPASRAGSYVFISPGIKLAYTMGEGFTFGIEVSVMTNVAPYFLVGGAINYDTNFSTLSKLRLGAQICGPFVGLETGPSVVFRSDGPGEEKRHAWGWGFTPWVGAGIVPFYTFTLVNNDTNIHEVGSYLKMPFWYRDDGESGFLLALDFPDD